MLPLSVAAREMGGGGEVLRDHVETTVCRYGFTTFRSANNFREQWHHSLVAKIWQVIPELYHTKMFVCTREQY